jgi:hypothetical protein
MQPPTAEGIQLLIDGASLERSGTGPIWAEFASGQVSDLSQTLAGQTF